MKLASLHYQLADDKALEILLENSDAFWFEQASESVHQRRYYDSFDWRLYQAKQAVYSEDKVAETRLYWQQNPAATHSASSQIPPVFAEDLPHDWQSALKPILAMRSLEEKLSLDVRVLQYNCLNRYDKTMLRLYITYYQIEGEISLEDNLPISLDIEPIRGYHKPYELMQARVEELGLDTQKPKNLLKRCLKLAGLKANDYSAKLRLDLTPELNTDSACRVILGHLANSLNRNYAGTCAGIDSEYLHDFRVAGRRSRALLSQVKGAFAPEQMGFLKTELAWLSQTTSPTRDADVYLLKFETYRERLPEAMQADLEPFKQFLTQHQQICHAMLKNELEGKRYQALMQDWQDFLDKETVISSDDAPNAKIDILTVANRRIWKAAQRLLKTGKVIDDDSPAEALHDLRKLAKKLRYLLEFFQSLYDKTEIKPLIKNLKILQDNLGDFQDFEVQAEQIQAFAEQMQNQYRANSATLMAMGALSATLLDGQAQKRSEFAACFQIFSADKALYKQLFKEESA